MIYTEADFKRLVEAVEQQDGVLLTSQCKAKVYKWSGKQLAAQTIAGCGNHMLFDIQYEPFMKKGDKREVTVCAVDDNVGMWPRFRHAIKDEQSG